MFYQEVQRLFPERYGRVPYKVAFEEWQDAWSPKWPNLLTEPDSEKAKASQAKLDSAVKIAQTILAAQPGPETKAAICAWLADVANDEKEFYSSQLLIDEDAIAEYEPEMPAEAMGDDPEIPEEEAARGHG